MMTLSVIEMNLEQVQSNIQAACQRSGRQVSDITLVGVTKTVDIDRIKELNLGENRVQELLDKYPAFDSFVNWHLIGHLQTNKVKYVIDKAALIHSVDSFKLAKEIDRHAALQEKKMDILVEINIAGEKSKYGIEPAELDDFLDGLGDFGHIMVKGLMCIAPYVENPAENRDFFSNMRRMFVDSASKRRNNMNMQYLSMGMTNDYEIAIEEGANIIRVGTGIFGERN